MLTEYTPDVIGLAPKEACGLLEASGKIVRCKTTAPKDHPVDQLRVIRQKDLGQDVTELVVSQRYDYMERGWK